MFLLVTVLTAQVVASSASVPLREDVVKSCERLFGPKVAMPELFEFSRFYVLRLQFTPAGELAEAAVEPRYFFRETHPEWEEPPDFEYLSAQQYQDILERLEKLRPKGSFIRRSDNALVTNLTCWHKEEFRNAVLEWGELCDLRRGESAPLLVRWTKVRYANR